MASPPVRATGIGRAKVGLRGPQARLMAQRAAQLDAARQLLAASNPTSVQSFPNRRLIQGKLRGHRYGSARFLPDGTAQVLSEMMPMPID